MYLVPFLLAMTGIFIGATIWLCYMTFVRPRLACPPAPPCLTIKIPASDIEKLIQQVIREKLKA